MQRFEAPTLEEAYAKAAKTFSCSVTQLEIEVVQHPSRGIFGFGKKSAIILVEPLQTRREQEVEITKVDRSNGLDESFRSDDSKSQESSIVEKILVHPASSDEETKINMDAPTFSEEEVSENMNAQIVNVEPRLENEYEPRREIFDNFYTESVDIKVVAEEVTQKLTHLFSYACFDIEHLVVIPYDEETLLVEFGGKDAALLIGKEGYRYKALAYLLYNWIHGQYGLKVRLEIAQFLQNQEAMIESYLETILPRIENEGRGSTKVLDGILVQIALQKLRERFPDKYVAVRTNREGGRYIIINEFMEKR